MTAKLYMQWEIPASCLIPLLFFFFFYHIRHNIDSFCSKFLQLFIQNIYILLSMYDDAFTELQCQVICISWDSRRSRLTALHLSKTNNKQTKNKKKTKDFITINIERCQERIWQPLLLFHFISDAVLVLVSTLLPSLIHAQCQLFTHAHIIETKKKHQTDSHGVVWAWSLNKSHRTNVYLVICWKAVFFAICLCYIVC